MSSTRKSFLRGLGGAAAAGAFTGGPAGLLEARSAASAPPKRRKIAEVQVYPFTLEAKQILKIALGDMSIEEVLVRLRTDDGVVGWGEASPYPPVTGDSQTSSVTVGKSMAKVLLGQNPFELPRIIAAMDVFTSGHPTIKAAFEMALWDICGKIAGQPVCHLLGQYRDSFETDRTVYLDTPEVMAQKAKAIADEGFKVVKIKLGQAPEYDIERLRAVRAAVGSKTRLRIDANQGWPPAAAVRALRGLERFDVEFCEQPGLDTDWEGMKYVRNHSPIPIMADECVHSPADAIRLVRLDAADMINIKLMKTGGILNAARIADIADAANMKCMLGCMSETRIGLTAAAHVVAAKRCVAYADLDSFTEHKDDPVVGGMRLKDGVLFVPDTPGLGLDMDPAFMKTLRAA